MEQSNEVRLQQAMDNLRAAQPQDAIAILDDLVASGDDQLAMFAHGLLGPAYVALGDLARGRSESALALDLATKLEDAESAAQYSAFLDQLAQAGDEGLSDDDVEAAFSEAADLLTEGRGADAATRLTGVIAWSAATGRLDIEASARGMMAQAQMMAGHFDEAKRHLLRAVYVADTLEDEDAQRHFTELLQSLDSADEAQRAITLSRFAAQVQSAVQSAGASLSEGDADAVLQLLFPLLTEAKELAAPPAEATLRGLIAQALLMNNEREEAIAHARRALAIAKEAEDEHAIESFHSILELAVGLVPPIADA